MIYENIVKYANKKNLSIREVEILAGLGNGTVGNWRTKSPTVDKLRRVAKVLGISISTLLKE